MTRTTTRYVSFQTLQARGSSANTVIKLMMACNDLSLANQSLDDWKKELPSGRKDKQVGAGMYFVRTQLAHLHEGLKIIEELRKDPTLIGMVGQCDSRTQTSFQELEQFLPKAPRRAEFDQLVGRVRHSLTFHYDESGKLIERAVTDRAQRSDGRTSSVTRGTPLTCGISRLPMTLLTAS